MTVGFNASSGSRLNPPVACGDSPPSSGALGMAESSAFPLSDNDDRRQWRKQGEVVWKCSLPMRQAADGFAPRQHFPPIRRRGEVGEGGIEVLGPALPGGGAGAA